MEGMNAPATNTVRDTGHTDQPCLSLPQQRSKKMLDVQGMSPAKDTSATITRFLALENRLYTASCLSAAAPPCADSKGVCSLSVDMEEQERDVERESWRHDSMSASGR